MTPRARFNPFPGLRPFEPDEDHLFFGREREIDALVRRLRTTRFLSVVGASGSGKSSLVRSGLIPSLQSGLMVSAGSSWRVALFRPGGDPTGNLARALAQPEALGDMGDLGATTPVILDAALRRSSLGLIDVVRQSGLDPADNLLVVVDQFEELFRFRRSGAVASRDQSIAFVKLLVEASREERSHVYVVLTMRSDFIGDCMEYPGLAEAVSAGQYLVPRMSRNELRSAIEGPVAVGGGRIAPRLVLRMLNDVGDDPDQLPVLQHALMRTWDRWTSRDGAEEIDLEDYEAVGTLRHALSRHAEEAYAECTGSHALIAERVFKALTDTFSDRRGIRRPTTIGDLAAICEAPESEVVALVQVFRATGRSFLTPPPGTPLSSRTVVDVAHESLMRCWTRLMAWADEERASATFYVRLSQATTWFEEGTAGLWRNPELALGLRWRAANTPTAAWAARYNRLFDKAMAFLDRSAEAQREEEAARDRARMAQLRLARWAAAVLGALLIAALGAMWMAWRESTHAEANFRLARNAVDQTLASAEVDPARMGADTPQLEEFRRSLLERTKAYYARFIQQKPSRDELRQEDAAARYRLGHIDRMLGLTDAAAAEYRDAIQEFERLARSNPDHDGYRSALADAYNYLGETYRPQPAHAADADAAYERAMAIAATLVHDHPEEASYRRQLARTHYNRGILRSMTAAPGDAAFQGAEADFREAVRLLEPMRQDEDRTIPQELARALNNLASLISQDDGRIQDARPLYEHAVQLDRDVLKAEPANRQVALELSKFENNLAEVLRALGDTGSAAARNGEAITILERLARPAPSLGVELADAHTLRGRILGRQEPARALEEYARAYEAFARWTGTSEVRPPAEFHLRYGDLLLNLAALNRNAPDIGAAALLSKAVATYLDLAAGSQASGSTTDMRAEADTLAYVMPALPAQVRQSADARLQALRQSLSANR